MVAMCLSAVWRSFLAVDINPFPVHLLPVVALLCHSKHSTKRKEKGNCNDQAPVVQREDNFVHRINHYPADSALCFDDIYPLDSYLSDG